MVDGAGKGVSGDALGQDTSRRAELVGSTDVIVAEARCVAVSAAAEVGCTGGLSESSTFADAEATTAALGFWMRVEFEVRVDSYQENGS